MGRGSNSFSKTGIKVLAFASFIVAALAFVLLIFGSRVLSQTSIPGIIEYPAMILTVASLVANRLSSIYVWGVSNGKPKLSIAWMLIVFIFVIAVLSIVLFLRGCSISSLSVYSLLMFVLAAYDWLDKIRSWKNPESLSNEINPMDDADNKARERVRTEMGPHLPPSDSKWEDSSTAPNNRP